MTSKIPQKERRQTSGQMIRQPGIRSRQGPWARPSSHEGEGIDGILIFLKVPNFLGGSRKDYSVTASDVLGSLHLYLCFLRIIMEKLLMGCFSYLWRDF